MYLKSIEVQGFKSFANKITFEFHNGITGIVGPNGSGKSNVADAVRWVLGEQSAKQLRGGNMQDVIFSGTEARKPLGYASVAITLDNSDHCLDIEYEEVTVTRRLYRSGESEYLLNGGACRLRDINELFYDTGIGKEGYSIIGQGQIDKILSGKPEERRELFDEAAGIVKFKRRKNTALKKLAEEEQNLVRVTDILSELTRQLGPLERQSETAKIYLKKRDELKNLDINMFLLESSHIKKQLAEVGQKERQAKEELAETTARFEETKAEYERIEEELESLEEETTRLRDKTSTDALSRQQLENQIELLKEQIRASAQSDQHYEERLEAIRQDLDKRQSELADYHAQEIGLTQSGHAMLDQQDQARGEVNRLQQEIAVITETIDASKNEIIEILNQRAATRGKMQRYDAMLEQIGIRRASLTSRTLELKSEERKQQELLDKRQGTMGEITQQMETLNEEYHKTEEILTGLRLKMEEQNRKIESCQSEYHRSASRLESLRNITERYEGYGNSIRKVMEQKDRQPGILGVVADLIKVPKQYETAIETALGGSIQNVVTDNDQTAKYMIEYLKRNRLGRATFLPLTNMKINAFPNKPALKEPGVIGVADTLVEAESMYERLVSQLLGRTLVVDQIDHAIAIARKYNHTIRIVTKDGELLSPGGSMTGGAFKSTSNLLGRRREIEELEKSVGKLQCDLQRMQTSIASYKEERNQNRDRLANLAEQIQKLEISESTEQVKLKQAKNRIGDIRDNFQQLKKEQMEIEGQIQDIETSSESIQKELEQSKQQEQQQESLIESRQKILEEKQQEEAKASQLYNDMLLEAASLQQKLDFVQENVARIREEMETLKAEQETILHSMESGKDDVGKKEAEIQEIRETIAAADQVQRETQEQLSKCQKKREALNAQHKSFFERRDELSNHMNLLDKECFRLTSQLEKLEEQQEERINYLWEEYEMTPGQAEAHECEVPMERGPLKKAIAELKDGIRKLGSVNVNAIEEYKEISERHAFLSNQHSDLVQAAETLKKIIAELDEGMRKQFVEKFALIRSEFDKAFKQLFGGGKGTLELMEEEDVLEAGIRIISQPPGKKLQNMMQLSGGEKALTAIALLFAIQNLKPSPFCLLDEIEAALDDSNVTRFAQYLHKLTKNTQFIIITHRRGTMNAADRLYGITMQEKGVSTLVSVNLIENQLDQ